MTKPRRNPKPTSTSRVRAHYERVARRLPVITLDTAEAAALDAIRDRRHLSISDAVRAAILAHAADDGA